MNKSPAASITVADHMTPAPHCIGMDQPLERAAERMTQLGVRHLPVLEAGQLVGMLSERDLTLLRSLAPGQLVKLKVEEAMSGVPYCVEPTTPLGEVARQMALRKLGSAVVVEHGRVIGVFTTTDALEVLAALLQADDASDEERPLRH
jgi:acetoin utilization protein AcuB